MSFLRWWAVTFLTLARFQLTAQILVIRAFDMSNKYYLLTYTAIRVRMVA